MKRTLRALVIFAAVMLTATAMAKPEIQSLVSKLESGADFRVRVQAALELGKIGNLDARKPLERALRDSNAAVRAASAAALKVLGDPRAIAALKKAQNDKSAAVRSQIKSSIAALEGKKRSDRARSAKAEVLVEVGTMSNGVSSSKTLVWHFEQTSRTKLNQIDGVEVLEDGEDSAKLSKSRKLPVVKVSGKLRKLERSKEGSSVVYSARVEFVVHRMPGNAIKGTVSGSARASTSAKQAKSGRRLAQLRREAVAAAVSSALRRAPEAIKAAAE